MPYANKTSQMETGRRRVRFRYLADANECAGCPLADRCLSGNAKRRQVGHEQHEAKRVAHAEKMSSEQAKTKCSRRSHSTERPFAVIKSHFGMRQFSTRGIARVRQEWLWLACAFNLHRLLRIIASGADPPLLPI